MLDRNKFISQLKEIVAVRGMSRDMETLKRGLDIVESWIDKRAYVVRIQNGSAEILLASVNKSLSPKIGYLVHFDVVSAESEMFELNIDGDKLKGRGVSDMKFSIPIGIALLNEAIDREISDFVLAITTDEEIGGFDGAKYLADEMKFRPKILIVPDGGDNNVFVEKAKGVCQIIVEASGLAAHSSRPWLGRNANNLLIKFGVALLDRYEKQCSSESWLTTLNIGQISGGISVNQVPDKALMKIDFRYPEDITADEIYKEMLEMAALVSPDLKIIKGPQGLPTITNIDTVMVKKYFRAMKSVGVDLEIKQTYGASDARHFAEIGTEILMSKPIGGEIHSPDEWISLSSTMSFYEGLRRFLFDVKLDG